MTAVPQRQQRHRRTERHTDRRVVMNSLNFGRSSITDSKNHV